MKRLKRTLQLTLIYLSILFINGCLDYTVHTTIKKNGQISQSIILKGDSTELFDETEYIFDLSDWEKDTILLDNDEYEVIARKHFANADELNDYYESLEADRVKMEIHVKKQFRWFFTHFNVNMTAKAFNPFNTFPIQNYMSEEEIITYNDADSLTQIDLDEKLDNWYADNMVGETFSIFKQGVLNSGNYPVSDEELEYWRDFFKENYQGFEDSLSYANEFVHFYFAQVFPDYNFNLNDYDLSEMERFNRKKDFFDRVLVDDVFFELTVPGTLIETNAREFNEEVLSWEADDLDMLFLDYNMNVITKYQNIWAFILSGILVLAFIVSFFIPSKK